MADEKQFLDYEGLSFFKELLNGVDIVTATGDGTAYTATVPSIAELRTGQVIVIIPDTTSTATIPSLNVNKLGVKNIKQRLSINTALTAEAANDSWMIANKPIPLMYDGTQWVTITGRPSGAAIHGIVGIKNGGTGGETAEEARTNLGAQAQHKPEKVTLHASDWVDKTQSVNVPGVTTDNTVLVGADPAYNEAYVENSILCTKQGEGTLTFACENTPTDDVQVNVIILQ